jgi:hypothetical protein
VPYRTLQGPAADQLQLQWLLQPSRQPHQLLHVLSRHLLHKTPLQLHLLQLQLEQLLLLL